eukprot:COSAG06_NODE_5935_length_3200_cov_10.149952_3_plen_75_part_00
MHLFFEFSLCLSRACLGKMITFIYQWLKKDRRRFLTCIQRDEEQQRSAATCEKRLFSQLFLCLSRACLGKVMSF